MFTRVAQGKRPRRPVYLFMVAGSVAAILQRTASAIGVLADSPIQRPRDLDGKTYAVKLVVKDSQSNPNRAAEVASRLILSDKVDLMLVSSTPETTNPVSDQCEANGTPCVSSRPTTMSVEFCPR